MNPNHKERQLETNTPARHVDQADLVDQVDQVHLVDQVDLVDQVALARLTPLATQCARLRLAFANSFANFSQLFVICSQSFRRARKFLQLLYHCGCVRTCLNGFGYGCAWMRSDMLGRCWKFSDLLPKF